MFYTGTVKWTTLKDRDRCVDSPKLGPWSCGSVLLGEGFRTLLKVPGQAEDSAASTNLEWQKQRGNEMNHE